MVDSAFCDFHTSLRSNDNDKEVTRNEVFSDVDA